MLVLGIPWHSVVKTHASTAGDTGSVSDWGTKIPHAKKYCVCLCVCVCVYVCRPGVGVLFKTCKWNFSEGFLRASICLLS